MCHKKGLGGLLLCFCLSTVSGQMDTVSVALGYIPHVQFAPFYIAESQGYFAQENINVKLQYITSLNGLAMVAQNQIDIALIDSDQVIFARTQGMPVQVFYQYYQKSPITLFTTNQLLTSPEKLNGQIVGTPELHGACYVGLMIFLSHYQLKNKVKIMRIGYEQIALLVSGKIDLAVGYSNNEPIFFAQSRQFVKEWPLSQIAPLLAGPSLVANQFKLQKDSNLFLRFSHALEKATRDLIENPEASFEKIAPLLRISPSQKDLMLEILKSTTRDFISLDTTPKSVSYTYTIKAMEQLGLIKEEIPAAELIATLS